MIRSRFLRFAQHSLLATVLTLGATSPSLHAISNDQVPPRAFPDSQIPRMKNGGITQPASLPNLTLRIKQVTCVDGHVAVKVRLQNVQNGNIGITVPFATQIKVGGHTAVIPSGASPQNPWYNGQEKGANLFPGYGTFQVSAAIDYTNLVSETDEGNNAAPSLANSFDNNPTPLTVTCAEPEAPASQGAQKSKKGSDTQKSARSGRLQRDRGTSVLRTPARSLGIR